MELGCQFSKLKIFPYRMMWIKVQRFRGNRKENTIELKPYYKQHMKNGIKLKTSKIMVSSTKKNNSFSGNPIPAPLFAKKPSGNVGHR